MSKSELWPIPYLSKLEGHFTPGQSLTLKGVFTGEKADFYLQTGPTPHKDDVVFHFSVRTKDKNIILNTFKNGVWEKEQKVKSPYKSGEEFNIRVRAHDNKFELFADHKELVEFEYRYPLNNITHVYIEGTLELHNISWGGRYYEVPYKVGVEHGFTQGKRLFVSGVPKKGAKRVTINLFTAKGDIALHYDIRFDEKKIIRNSQVGGAFQQEEKEPKFIFEKETGFDIIIANEPTAFAIHVNDAQVQQFPHRIDHNSIVGIEILGEVELQGVFVK